MSEGALKYWKLGVVRRGEEISEEGQGRPVYYVRTAFRLSLVVSPLPKRRPYHASCSCHGIDGQ